MNEEKSIYWRPKGLDWDREIEEQSNKDWNFLAASSPEGLVKIPNGQRDLYLPRGEKQNIGEEKMDCASRAPNNILETDFNWLIKKNLISLPNLEWLKNNKYIINGEFEVSDAFITILSGTTRSGNSLKAPCLAIHDHGLVPKALLPQVNSFADHHNPQRITPQILDLGKRFKERFPINFERVVEKDYDAVLDRGSFDAGLYAWPVPEEGEYHRQEDRNPNHAVDVYKKPKFHIFDNYVDSVDGDFIKKLASNYKLMPYGYRIFISAENRTIKKYRWFCRWLPQHASC